MVEFGLGLCKGAVPYSSGSDVRVMLLNISGGGFFFLSTFFFFTYDISLLPLFLILFWAVLGSRGAVV